MHHKSRRGLNIKTETLLKHLARDGKNEKVRLRCCELLLMLEGRLKEPAAIKPANSLETSALATLAETQDVESKEHLINGQLQVFNYHEGVLASFE